MRALVTGGHGFVGSHLVERLLGAGHDVRILYRRPGSPAVHAGRPVEIARGDVRDPGALASALEGVDTVFHLAALTRSLTRREMLETNVDGTRRLLEAARDRGLPGRFVFCSSLAAVGPTPSGPAPDEAAPRRPLTWYGESKALAEDACLEMAGDLDVVIARPPGVYGPRDKDFLSLFQAVARGLAPVVGSLEARYSLVHGADLAAGLAHLGEHPDAGGRVFFVAHPTVVTQGDLVAAVEYAVGRRARRLRLPTGLLGLLGRATDLTSQLTGRATLLGSQRMKEVSTRDWVCDPSALVAGLGWEPRFDLRSGVADTVAWCRTEGLLPEAAGRPVGDPVADR